MVVTDRERQDALLALLNSTPVINGVVRDQLADPQVAKSWQQAHNGSGGAEEHGHLLQARDALQDVVRGDRAAPSLASFLNDVTSRPHLSSQGVSWELNAPAERRLAVEALLAWSTVQASMPGRLRPCANPECRLFLIDRSKSNKARWCSMAVCGNRMKARRYHQRHRSGAGD